MIGGGFTRSKDGGLDQLGVWDDSKLDAFPVMHIGGCLDVLFGEYADRQGLLLERVWTGILGFTGDEMPFVGKLPDYITKRDGKRSGSSKEEGEWVAAGFNGEGMVWAWLSGTAVAVMMLGMEDEVLEKGVGRPGGRLRDWFPINETQVDKERLIRANLRNFASEI